jgi:hypothetical protein
MPAILPEEEFLKLPVIALKGLETKRDAVYSEWQKFFLPYLDSMLSFWWLCFWVTLLYLAVRFLVLPTIKIVGTQTTHNSVVEEGNLSAFQRFYSRIFSLHEIRQDIALQLFGGAILIGYISTFSQWQMNPATTVQGEAVNALVCWPFFQNCKDWLWMQTMPYGYSQNTVFMGMFGLVALAAYGLLSKRFFLAHFCILILFIFKVYLCLISMFYNIPYDLYHNFFNIIFLFLPHKRFFGSFTLIWFYFLSTASKIHPTWVWGGYFNELELGLALIPRGWEIFPCNLVIFMEMVISWFLLSHRKWLQRSVFSFFCFFHLYSGTIVGYHYPSIVMPPLLIFFGTLFRPFEKVPFGKSSIACWMLMLLLFTGQMYVLTNGKDPKLTLEGVNFSLYMFDANHQCRVTVTDEYNNTLVQEDSIKAINRCNPWAYLVRQQRNFCQRPSAQKFQFRIISSINGGPFYEIVNEQNLCSLRYKAFGTNDWIKDQKAAPAVGRAKENMY